MVEIKKTIQEILDNCEDAQALYLTDREGTQIIRVGDEVRQFASIVAGHINSSEQIDRLEMGHHQSSVFFYGQTQLVILTINKVIAFIISSAEANTGDLMALREKLKPVVEEIENTIKLPPSDDAAQPADH